MLNSNVLHYGIKVSQPGQIVSCQINIPQGTTAITGIETGIRMEPLLGVYRHQLIAGQLQLFTPGAIDRCFCQYVVVPQIFAGRQELGYTHFRSGFYYTTALERSSIAQSWSKEPDQLMLPFTPVIYSIYTDQLAELGNYTLDLYLWLSTDDLYKQPEV